MAGKLTLVHRACARLDVLCVHSRYVIPSLALNRCLQKTIAALPVQVGMETESRK